MAFIWAGTQIVLLSKETLEGHEQWELQPVYPEDWQ